MRPEKYTVYILDDDAEDGNLLASAFENADYASEVHLFHTHYKLLEQLFFVHANEVPHLIVIDNYIPLMDGCNLVKYLRADKKLKRITLGIYSSGIPQQKLKEMFENGIDFFIEKGNTYNEMRCHIKKFYEAIELKQLNGEE